MKIDMKLSAAQRRHKRATAEARRANVAGKAFRKAFRKAVNKAQLAAADAAKALRRWGAGAELREARDSMWKAHSAEWAAHQAEWAANRPELESNLADWDAYWGSRASR